MRKFLFIGIAVAAISCTPGIKDDGTSNALQTENVSCQYLVYAKDTANPEWMSGFDSQKFFNDVFSHVYAKEVSVLNPNCITFSPSVIFNDTAAPYYDTASLSRDIKWNEQHTVSPEISSIFFFEKWNFDKQTKKLTKKVDYWSPIRRLSLIHI